LRNLLHEVCPALVANAEALSQNVRFFASSSFGHTPVKVGPGEYVPDPARLRPTHVEMPLLWILSQISSQLHTVLHNGPLPGNSGRLRGQGEHHA